MDPLDVAYKNFCAFAESISPDHWDSIVTEADTRMKLIDKVFTQVLGWPEKDIHLEDAAGEKRIDYRFTIDNLNRMIVEAKRKGRDLGISADYKGRGFKLDGSVFKTEAAQEGIDQTIHYCMYRGAELACVTNGHQWMVFRGNRAADGTDVLKGTAIVFGSLDAVSSIR
jgi:predicted type IV restriction endonuclease